MRVSPFVIAALLAGAVQAQPADQKIPEPPLNTPAARSAVPDTTPLQEAVWLYQEGVRLHRDGYLVRAVDAYRRALAKDPRRLEYRPFLALALDQLGQSKESLEQYDLYLKMEPNDARIRLDRAGALLHMGDLEAVRTELEALRPWISNRSDYHNWWGMLYLRQNKPAEAVKSFREALVLEADRLDSRVNLGLALLMSGDSAGADEQFSLALKQKSGPVVLNNLGVLMVQQNRLGEASKLFEQAWQPPASDAPSTLAALPEALLNQASLLARQGKDREALLLVSKLLDYKSDFLDAQVLYARLLAKMGRAAEGRKEMDKVIEAGPDVLGARWPYALEISGLVYLGMGEDDLARLDLQKAVLANPESASARHNLALALGRMGDFQEAIEEALAAQKLAPGNPSVAYHLGVLYDLDARPKLAIQAYRRFLELFPQDPEAEGLKEHIDELERAVRGEVGKPVPKRVKPQ